LIIADTGGVIALLDRQDRHHRAVRALFEEEPSGWLLPWAILPEVDSIAGRRLGASVALAFQEDVRDGLFRVDGQITRDLPRATELVRQYLDLHLGLVDAVVMAQAERHRAHTIVTTDARHFRTVKLDLPQPPRLVPIG
jgi:uncharacterized protein